MKFSYNWIKELVPGLAVSPQELDRLITMKTAECEGFEETGALLAEACAARVVAVEEIAGSHNRKAEVETGRYGTKTVVCGAPNCRVGMTTAYVPLGKKVIGSVESDGMLASGAELGINRDHAGVVEFEAAPGEPVPGCAPDVAIEIDNKSLTHRPDLWGHEGMAREVAAITGGRLKDPVDMSLVPDAPPPVRVSIEDLALAPRYSALVVENIQVGRSPLWLQYRLEAIGLNPINNVVDATNFVMAELSQPMHAFDADKLQGDTIYTRPARAGEKIRTLDGETYELTPANVVIADASGPIALAGVMGGFDSAINEFTTRVVLESANFDGANIRKTSTRLRIRTDASMRFEKSQDPENTVRGLARAVELLKIVSPGCRVAGGLADQRRTTPAPPPIVLPMGWLIRKLGRDIAQDEVRRILAALQFGVAETAPGVLSVTVPSWRATKDISIKDDLVEEVGRMIGYGSVVPTAPLVPSSVPPANPERMFLRRLRGLVSAQGFTEVYNYSFISDRTAQEFGLNPDDQVRVSNPISEEQDLLRTSLIPGIHKNILQNVKNFDRFRLFEIGREIHGRPEGLPEEVTHLAAAVYSKAGDGDTLTVSRSAGAVVIDTRVDVNGLGPVFELKRLAECLLPGCEVEPAAALCYEHPARTANVVWRGEVVGRLFEFHPSKVDGRGAVLDVNLVRMQALEPEPAKYKPIQRFPSSAFDLSVVADMRQLIGSIERRLRELAGADLESLEFVRVYAGLPVPAGKQSVSYRLTVASADRTLSSEEVGAIRARIIAGLQAAGWELRV